MGVISGVDGILDLRGHQKCTPIHLVIRALEGWKGETREDVARMRIHLDVESRRSIRGGEMSLLTHRRYLPSRHVVENVECPSHFRLHWTLAIRGIAERLHVLVVGRESEIKALADPRGVIRPGKTVTPQNLWTKGTSLGEKSRIR